MVTGIALGLLIGILSGAVFIWMLNGLASAATIRDGLKMVVQILLIATFWFAGPWLARGALKEVRWPDILEPYAASLALTFLVISLWPLVRFILRMGKVLSQHER
jgi:hypothetical protein